MKSIFITVIMLFNIAYSTVYASPMTQKEMEKIISNKVKVLSQKKGHIVFKYKKIKMLLISDAKYNRMRIVAPIIKYKLLSDDKKDAVMKSNFHMALDARYAVSDNVLYSAFIHPMSPLTAVQLEDALNQVSTLARTFGTLYSSGQLSYGVKK
ncbi:hypothetical protein MNBD_GAMMA22-880 [hydrothermal vent metagenome]|uniref:Uncharacterized protein n=1 Tax=hydrothermal vent metagenome TaxID=652676 RepID=A0A3B1ARD2_9ZZZZ